MSDEQKPELPRITKITVTPKGVARARRESMERAGVGVSVTPELLKHAEEQGRKLRAKRARNDEGREQPPASWEDVARQMNAALEGHRRHNATLSAQLAEVTREREELREQNSKLHRDLARARQLARWLWRLDGVRQQWTPPEKYELDWLTRDEPS